MIYLYFAIIVVVSYFIGSVNFARILAWKKRKQDITTKGSFNPGTMNMLRVYGFGIALWTLILEFIKGGIPALISGLVMEHFFPGMFYIAYFVSGLSAVIGQIFPAIYKFKGGKGLGTCAGVFFFSPLWWVGIILFIICFIELYFINIASVVTLTYITLLGVATTIYMTVFETVKLYFIIPFGRTLSYWWVALVLMWCMIAIVYIAHRKNFYRLVHGKENKINFKKNLSDFFHKKDKKVEIEENVEQKPEAEIVVEDTENKNN
jgi:glycerol-3-phosphate acyltransferase PlsY